MNLSDILDEATLIDHAKRELRILGYQIDNPELEAHEANRQIAADILALLRLFASQTHTRHSANYLTVTFGMLANLRPLAPLTGEADEWRELPGGFAQNIRYAPILRRPDGVVVHVGKVVYVDPETGDQWQDESSTRDVPEFPYFAHTDFEDRPKPTARSALGAGQTHRELVLPPGVTH